MKERLRGARLREERDGKEAGWQGKGGKGMEELLPPQPNITGAAPLPSKAAEVWPMDRRAAAPQNRQALSSQRAQCPMRVPCAC